MINSVLILVYIDHFVQRVFMKHPHAYVPARRSEMDFFGTSCWDSKLHFSLDQRNTEINFTTNWCHQWNAIDNCFFMFLTNFQNLNCNFTTCNCSFVCLWSKWLNKICPVARYGCCNLRSCVRLVLLSHRCWDMLGYLVVVCCLRWNLNKMHSDSG